MRKTLLAITLTLVCTLCFAQPFPADTMQSALKRLEKLSETENPLEYTTLLCDIATMNMAASLDIEAEKYASKAENVAREAGLDEVIARALIIKANICLYAEVDRSFNRNDEGLHYVLEAIKLAEKANNANLLYEAYCSESQIYINKNRWNTTLNEQWYAKAGECLDKAEEIAKTTPPANLAKMQAFRIRYYRQGNNLEEAIKYCERTLETCADNDYLLKSQAYDQLASLYSETGKFEEAAAAHNYYVQFNALMTRQNEAEKLQEMQAKYEMELSQAEIRRKTYQILFLASISVFLVLVAVFLFVRIRKERKLRAEAEQGNLAKQELIEFITKDLHNPLNNGRSELEKFVGNASKMTEEQITEAAQKLLEEERHLSRDVAEYVSDIIIRQKKKVSDFGLSARELEIVHLSLEGLSAAQIADKLFVSTRTVSNHKANIYTKMGVRSNAEMCRKAREIGIN